MNYFRGSEWTKWDLHIHTPASFFWKGGKKIREMDSPEKLASIQEFVHEINSSDIDAYCIMDYWTFEWCLELIKFKTQNPHILEKRVFFGMELRIECPVNYRLNIHVILSDELTEQNLQDFKSELIINIGTSPRKISDSSLIELAKSFDISKARVHGYGDPSTLSDTELLELGSKTAVITRESLKKAMSGLPKESGFILLPYDTSDGIIDLDWQSHPQDDNYFMQSAHIFESRKIDAVKLFNGIKDSSNERIFDNFFKTIGKRAKPCVSGSDAHKFSEYGLYPNNRVTWIKSNPTFEGLKQIIYVPSERVRIQETNPELEKNHWKILDIEILNSNIDLIPDQKIEFNSGLNSIIGGRGTGKSGLLSLISSLNGDGGTDKFLNWLRGLGDFEIKVSLLNKDGNLDEYDGKLSEEHNFSLPIFYLSQEDIEKFSNENKKEEYRKKFLQVIGIEDTSYYYNGGILLSKEL